MASRPHNQPCGTRTTWTRVILALEAMTLILMVVAFSGKLVIQRMMNEGVSALGIF